LARSPARSGFYWQGAPATLSVWKPDHEQAAMNFRERIRDIVVERRIPNLAHFTLLSNLPGIVRNGLLCRADLLAGRGNAMPSAVYRLDEQDAAVSVSVTAINFRMFEGKRKASRTDRWVVLLLDPSILWTHDCRFFSLNAAKNEMKHHRGRLDGPWAFERMFADDAQPFQYVGASYREETGIPHCLTTRAEAEVQVFGTIMPTSILEAWVETNGQARIVEEEFAKIGDGREREVTARPFVPRFYNRFDEWG
jgi:hypothetical protein